jgi:DtxR family manganese transport transcriptional regulator
MELRQEAPRVVDLQKVFAVSHVTVIRAVEKLETAGLLRRSSEGIELTPDGRALGQKCYERHLLVESFLVSLGISEETAARDAEGIEHHLSPETLAAMRNHLG